MPNQRCYTHLFGMVRSSMKFEWMLGFSRWHVCYRQRDLSNSPFDRENYILAVNCFVLLDMLPISCPTEAGGNSLASIVSHGLVRVNFSRNKWLSILASMSAFPTPDQNERMGKEWESPRTFPCHVV